MKDHVKHLSKVEVNDIHYIPIFRKQLFNHRRQQGQLDIT